MIEFFRGKTGVLYRRQSCSNEIEPIEFDLTLTCCIYFLLLTLVTLMGLIQSCFLPPTRRRTRKRGVAVARSSAVRVIAAAGSNTFTAGAGNGLLAVIDHSKTDNGHDGDTNGFEFERGESSNDAPPFICEICTETKTAWESFTVTATTCSHAFCSECVFTYVSSKLQQNQINITCPIPECSGLLEAEDCRAILPPEVVDRWLTALCEAMITASEKFYCPFVDCSAMLIDDGTEKVTESECPNCRRLFCAQCKVPWHNEVTCDEFQKMNQEEKGLVVKLSKEMKKCPNCRFYIAKSDDDGDVIRCRCGYAECSDTAREGESSNAAPFTCEICTETKTAWESFGITGCSHAYCSDCVAMYVRSKVEENVINIKCPVSGCSGLLEAEDCRAILPMEVFDRWGKASSEAMIAESEKFYCPFANCSALLIDDGKEKVTQSECPDCRRLFCAQCKVPWHAGVTCAEYQRLGKDDRGKEDLMLIKLAKDKKWRRCPNCKLYVAKSDGCMYMRCRCGYTFCYNCGTPNLNKKTHYCDTCRRTY